MGLLLAISNIYIPDFLKRRKLAMLFGATADAFRVDPPSTRGLSYDDCLKLYADFTREQADQSMQRGDEPDVQGRLFQNACRIGLQFRTDFGIRTAEEVMRMGAIIYRSLKIDFEGDPQGDITIKRCFFSDYYPGPVCRLISSLDGGLLSGLSGSGRLTFSGRITEGNDCCRARLEMPGRCI
jgi:hypothetical protein